MAISLSREKVIDQWNALIENGAGRDTWVLDKTEEFLRQAQPPNVVGRREEVSAGMFGEKRPFLMITHKTLREFAMFINARDFGVHLDVSWYLTVNPGFFKRAISKKLVQGDPNALSTNLTLFAQQDLHAFTKVVDNCLQEAIRLLMDDLKQDYSTINRKSKGFLSVW
jgi:hypothetical protein